MVHKPALPTFGLLFLVCLYALVFGVLAARAYPAHETGAFDLGVYDQALWNAAQGRGLSLTLAPQVGPTRFSVHVEPILFLIVPIYRYVSDDPRVLLWLQSVLIALGGLPLYGLARRRLANDWAALTIVVAFYLLPALESVNLFDFHAVGLAPTLLLAALYFLDQALITVDDSRGFWTGTANYQISNSKSQITNHKSQIANSKSQIANSKSQITNRKSQIANSKSQIANHKSQITNRKSQIIHVGLSGLFFLLALGAKEDVSLHVFMIGLYLLVLRRRWRSGLALIVVGLAWFYVAFYVIIPASRPTASGSAYVGFYDALGDTPLDIALSPLRTPKKVFSLLVTPENIQALKMLTLPLALMPLVGLPIFILAAPTLAITFLSSNPLMHQLETYHYAAPAIPFVILAAVDGVARVSNLKSQITNRKSADLKSANLKSANLKSANLKSANLKSANQRAADSSGGRRFLLPTPYSLLPTLYSLLPTPLVLSLLVLITSLAYHYYRGYSPLARPFHWPAVTAHQQLGDDIAASILPLAPVVAQAELVPLASHRPWIEIWQGPLDERADYYLWDVSHPAFVNRDGAQERLLSDIARDPSVGPTMTQDGFLLVQRGAPRCPTTPEFFTFAYADPPASATPVSATFGDTLELVAVETHRNYADREAEPLVTLYWRVLSPPEEDYFIAVFLLDDAGQPVGVTRYQQPLTVWWPTSRWEPGSTVRMLANTFPWWTGDRRHFGYGVSVVRGAEPWRVASRLPVVRDDGGLAPLDEGTLLPLAEFKRVAGIPYEVEVEAEVKAEAEVED